MCLRPTEHTLSLYAWTLMSQKRQKCIMLWPYLPCMVSNTLSPFCRVPCSSSCFLLFLLLHSEDNKPGWDPSMLTLHLQRGADLQISFEDTLIAKSTEVGLA